MKTVGMMLQEERIKKKLTLTDIEVATKIRVKFLQAIENDDFTKLPSPAYAKGFVHNYSEYLGLNTPHIMAFFRRQLTDVPKSMLLPRGMSEPLNRTLFQLTPGRFLGIIIAGLCLLFLLYFGVQYRRIQSPPNLRLDSPQNDMIVTEERIDVTGRTDPDATVTINGVGVLLRSDGKFFDQVSIKAGENTITVVATSRFGKSAAVVKKVLLNQQ